MLFHFIRDFSLKQKIFLGFTLFVTLPLLLIYCGSLWYTNTIAEKIYQKQLYDVSLSLKKGIKEHHIIAITTFLTTVADQNIAALNRLVATSETGGLTKDEAQWLAESTLLSHTIGGTGYIYCTNSQGKILFHPDKNKINTFQSAILETPSGTLPQTGLLVKNIFDEVKTADDEQPVQELFRTYFPPWKWFISIAGSTANLLEPPTLAQLKPFISHVRESSPHQCFVINASGAFILVSNTTHEIDRPYTDEFRKFLPDIQKEKEGHFTYRSTLIGMKERDKTIMFTHLPEQNLIIGVSAYNDELYKDIHSLRNIFILLLLLCLGYALLCSFLLGRRFARPIRNFSQKVLETKGGTEILLIEEPGFGELASLTTCFNDYMRNISKIKQVLEEEKYSSECIQRQLEDEIKSKNSAFDNLEIEISTRKSAESYLQLFKSIFDNAIEGIVITDKNSQILAVNTSFTQITGFRSHEVMGKNPKILSSGKHDNFFYKEMWASLNETGSWSGEIQNKKKNGTLCSEWLSISEIKDTHGELTHYFAFFHDISELKKKEKQITFMAYHDALTKLPNRVALENRLSKAISHASRNKGKLAVFFIDLDDFKKINDSLGHHMGDKLLIQVSERVGQTIRAEDTLSRLGGDEFILLSENIEHESAVFILANRILDLFKQPIILDSRKIYINASLGISIFPNDGDTSQELIKNADMAMYKAKSEGRNKFVMFTKEMNEKLKTQIRIENSIRTGLKNREFVVFYQPKVNLETENTSSFEALVRWQKNGQLISPDNFIPVAEESGLIDEMTLYVLGEVCLFHQTLLTRDIAIPISVNISPRTFNNLELVEAINNTIDHHGINHQLIDFEITETTAMKDVEHTLKVMREFRNRGTTFSIDDFGTGYSSLSYLSEMPVSTLKIDKRFIDIGDPKSMGIVSSIVAMSLEMHLKVVAEGTETSGQLRWLRSIGCTEAQGYFYSKPMPREETLQYLSKRMNKLEPLIIK